MRSDSLSRFSRRSSLRGRIPRNRHQPGGDLPKFDFDRLLETYVRRNASLLVLVAGSPPLILIEGLLRAMETPPLTPADVEELTFEKFTVRGQIGPAKANGYSYEDFWYGDVPG